MLISEAKIFNVITKMSVVWILYTRYRTTDR